MSDNTSTAATSSSSHPVVDLNLLNSNDKSAFSIYHDNTTNNNNNNKNNSASASTQNRLTSALYNMVMGWSLPKNTPPQDSAVKQLPSIGDKNVLTLSDDSDGFSHVGFRHLSYAEVAAMGKALHPQPTDKKSNTITIDGRIVYPDNEEYDDYDDNNNGSQSLISTDGEFTSLVSNDQVDAEFLYGDRAEREIAKNTRVKCKSFPFQRTSLQDQRIKWIGA